MQGAHVLVLDLHLRESQLLHGKPVALSNRTVVRDARLPDRGVFLQVLIDHLRRKFAGALNVRR